jgi:hypothetical protein
MCWEQQFTGMENITLKKSLIFTNFGKQAENMKREEKRFLKSVHLCGVFFEKCTFVRCVFCTTFFVV